jgi:chemotaxis regulatin CheY-phosphate phosphatase CheZ
MPLAPFGARRRMSQAAAAEIAMLAKALNELAAIRSTAEQAAGNILTCAEDLMAAPHAESGSRAEMDQRVADIIAACGFHDLVGQRVAKIAETLDKIMAVKLTREPRSRKPAGTGRRKRKARILLSGPELSAGGSDQAHIDALFAEA